MTLTTEDAGDVPEVTSADIDNVLSSDAFGAFAILAASETDFIQAGNDWLPSPACEQFMQQSGSDPWVLEYRESASDRQFRAADWVSLDQAIRAFHSYLAGTHEWRTDFEWNEIDL